MAAESRSSSESYFGLLGLPERFDLDPGALERAYLERSRESHPDRYATALPAERVAAVQRSMALNDAYQTLRRPARRAEYLLGRHGITIGDNERIADHDFLMKILALREELADARAAGRTGEVSTLQRAMQAHHRELVASLGPRFARFQASPAPGRAELLAPVKQTLIELRYVDRYLAECDAALDEDDDDAA